MSKKLRAKRKWSYTSIIENVESDSWLVPILIRTKTESRFLVIGSCWRHGSQGWNTGNVICQAHMMPGDGKHSLPHVLGWKLATVQPPECLPFHLSTLSGLPVSRCCSRPPSWSGWGNYAAQHRDLWKIRNYSLWLFGWSSLQIISFRTSSALCCQRYISQKCRFWSFSG